MRKVQLSALAIPRKAREANFDYAEGPQGTWGPQKILEHDIEARAAAGRCYPAALLVLV